MPLIIGLGAIVVVMLLAAAVLVFGRGETTSDQTTTAAPGAREPSPSTPTSTSAPTPATATGGTPDTPADMFSSAADPSEIIDRPSAVKVAKAFWPVHVDGTDRADAATLASVETGAALQWDSVACIPSCTGSWGSMVGEPITTAPPQSTYPASFLAQITVKVTSEDGSTGGVDLVLVVFTRASATAPWLAAIVAGYSGDPTLTKTATDFTAPAPAITGDIEPTTLPDAMAQYFDSYKRTGSPPANTPFRGNDTLGQRARITASTARASEAMGIVSETNYRSGASDDGFYTFAASPTKLVACSTIRWTTIETPARPGGTITVDNDELWPPIVPKGSYNRIERDAVRMFCLSLNQDCSCLTVTGLDGGTYAVRTS